MIVLAKATAVSSPFVSSVGLVLGGGGITGAAFHFGTLFALEMASGWQANDAEVVVGTSSGAVVAAMVRTDSVHLDSIAGTGRSREEINAFLTGHLLRRGTPRGAVRWLRHGLGPALRKPSLHAALASPGLYRTDGIGEWIRSVGGDVADGWPARRTAIVAYDVADRQRVPFGTEAAPEVSLADAVMASSAVPFMYEPVQIDGRWYADGGLASGTSADLVLANPEPLDLALIIAPLAATAPGHRTGLFADIFDRTGRAALEAEVAHIKREWPDTEVLILRPSSQVLDIARPNPMSVAAAIPTFLETLRSMRHDLADPAVWDVVQRHLLPAPAVDARAGS